MTMSLGGEGSGVRAIVANQSGLSPPLIFRLAVIGLVACRSKCTLEGVNI